MNIMQVNPKMGDTTARRPGLWLPLGLLFASALPDAMVVPVLHDLMVVRYGVSPAASHAFMCINLVGAILVIGLIGRLRQLGTSGSPGKIIAVAALVNALLLALMALPIGFSLTLFVRFLEGAADLIVYAFLFDYLAKAGPNESKGQRMGAAATCLMLGIATGIGLGGWIGSINPVFALWIGAISCLFVAPIALQIRTIVVGESSNETTADSQSQPSLRGPLWPSLVMMFSDRAVVGVLISTVPLFLASRAGLSSGEIGSLIGVSMLMTALGAWPAGRLSDRIGPLRLRLFAGLVYAIAFASIVFTAMESTTMLACAMLAFGIAGAALFASSLMTVVQSGLGPSGMAAYHTSGNLGFLLGPVCAGLTLKYFGGPGIGVYVAIIGGTALMHAISTTIVLFGTSLAWRRLKMPPSDDAELATDLASS
ncbi:MAG: MFS transporter [Planctomycetota bacterium]|nr:MFS transporter [Planctomycetota bacterium]